MTICCMLCRLTSDVDAAKADVTKAQKEVEAEKKLKLEANIMLKARLFSVCRAMVCAYAGKMPSQMLHRISINIPCSCVDIHLLLHGLHARQQPLETNDSLLSLPANAAGAV